ncbi:MAG: glutamine--tRNA ligase/YqeY domain fusion protein [Candidatus Brocadiaceae bacterium]|nr:glutamine--tRNA ligase/YqeY domain fusion protein [Candidatus Brocadiaceae bacterium]
MGTDRGQAEPRRLDFVRQIVADGVEQGRFGGRVHTRFPPEPNGYAHIGHAKACWLNYSLAREHGGLFNLRFDDTNPLTEESQYVDAIIEDLRWLGADWGDRLFFASDYFEQMYEYAVQLVRQGDAYVCDLTADEVREYRGTPTSPGRDSPYRGRSVEENLDLLARMKAGEFPDGARTLRARIDMTHPNLNLRDPVMYRILHATHYRRGDAWCIYPSYDWAHGLEDSIEGVTYSICSSEFENHRPLYDWFLERLGVHHPQQIEFARFNVSGAITSKRRLLPLIRQGLVSGWDDPRLLTIQGLRRRGYTPEALHDFLERTGISKTPSTADMALLEHCLREHLNKVAPRVMAVLDPLKVVLVNYPEGRTEELEAVNNPEDPAAGTRPVPFSRVLYVEREDFMEAPPRKFYRLAPGREVRLRYAYFITCVDVVKDPDTGEVVELHCTYDPATRGGDAPDGRKVKATLHWVSAADALDAEVRLYDRLILDAETYEEDEEPDPAARLNPDSLQVIQNAKVEPSLAGAAAGARYQFERSGYFCVDPDSTGKRLVFNRTVTLRDKWARVQQQST